MKEAVEKTRKVYHLLSDDLSRDIFLNRMQWLVTDDIKYIHKMIKPSQQERYEQLRNCGNSGKEVVVYGAGRYAHYLIPGIQMENVTISYICDKNSARWGKRNEYGIEIISPEQLRLEHKDALIIVGSDDYREEICEELKLYFSCDQILPFAYTLLVEKEQEMYFDPDIIKYDPEGEVFIDGGSYALDTPLIMQNNCNLQKVFAYECDPDNILKVKQGILKAKQKNPDIEIVLIEKGLWKEDATLKFSAAGNQTSTIAEDAETSETLNVEVTSIDRTVGTERVTFIKLDIEGAESKALEGARETILRNKPKLAISIYHKAEDLIELPLYLHSLVPEYRFYLRHYSNYETDTILYAVR